MSSPGTPLPAASFPVPPPLAQLQFVDPKTGMFTVVGLSFMTQMWAALQGSGGVIPTYLNKALAEGNIFVGQQDGNASGVPLSGDASIVADGEITVSRVRVQMTAAIDLSGHRAVFATTSGEANYPDIAVLADGIAVMGITTGAIVAGQSGPVQIAGEMSEPSWTWAAGGQIYVGDGGVLTQTVPSGAWVLLIAVARTATDITIGPRLLVATP